MRQFGLRLNGEFAREFGVGLVLLGQKISEIGSAEEIYEHSLALEPFDNFTRFDRVGNVLGKLRHRIGGCLGWSHKAEPNGGIEIGVSTFGNAELRFFAGTAIGRSAPESICPFRSE